MRVAALLLTAHPQSSQPDHAAMTKVDGRESALRAMELLTNREPIGPILMVVSPAAAEDVKQKAGSHLMFMGVKLVQAEGGWYEQTAAVAGRLGDDVTHVLVHDAARPAVPYTDLEALLASDAPAVALALPVRGPVARAKAVPGAGTIEPMHVASVLTPRLYDRAAFAALCRAKAEPSPLTLIEGSPLNVRCGDASPGLVKAMIGLLPKPKVNAPTNPFEEAQW